MFGSSKKRMFYKETAIFLTPGVTLRGFLDIAKADIGGDNGRIGCVATRKEGGGRKGTASFDLIKNIATG